MSSIHNTFEILGISKNGYNRSSERISDAEEEQ